MTGRYAWSLALMAILFWSVLTSASDGQAADITTILKQFPGYHVVTLQERNPDVRAYIVQHFPKANASVVHADFDGDGNEDYALLMKNDGRLRQYSWSFSVTQMVNARPPTNSTCRRPIN